VTEFNRKYIRHTMADLFVMRVLKADGRSTFFPLVFLNGMLSLASIKEVAAIGVA